MYYIDDYRQQAIDKIIPYLIEFPEIVSIIEDSADRYQAIEDVLWRIANNFKVINSRGVFLNAHAHNEVVNLVYTDKAKDAFTYGTEFPDTQAFGTGHFYSQASYLSGISKDVSEDKLIRAVQEKIIQNNTNGTIQDFIEAMKLHFNATSVNVYESYPLAISLMLSGEKLELSSSGNKEAIKKCLPACVSLNNLYINDHLFDQFMYSNKSGYANDSRYPITLGDSDYLYKYISTAVNLNSSDKEYIKINSPFYNVDFTQDETPFECICGQLTELNNNGAIYSFIYNSTNIYKISLITAQIDGKYYFVLSRTIWDNTNSTWQNVDTFNTNIKAELNKDYTFLLSINHDSFDFFRVWIFDGVKLIGQNSLQDTSWVYNTIQNNINFTQIQLNTTNISYEEQNIVNAEIVNYNNKNINNYSDFTYYCILGGVLNAESNIDVNNESSHYYTTCFGEKNILFNCLSNNNHIIINTDNTLQNNLTIKQSSYNYKKWHSNGKYLNIYNKINQPSITWNSQQPIDSLINSFDLSFDLCLPINLTPTFDRSKFTVVGSPTITDDGIASGFSNSNGINTSFSAITPSSSIIIKERLVYSSTPNTANGAQVIYQIIGHNSNPTLQYEPSTSKFVLFRCFNNSSTTTTITKQLQNGDIIESEVILTSSSAVLNIKVNGVNYTSSASGNGLYCGYFTQAKASNNNNYHWSGSIDLKQFKIIVDGKEVFSGSNSTANILSGLLGSNTKFNISYNIEQQKLIIVLPTYTSGNVEVPYTIEANLPSEEFIKKFNNLRIKYTDNKIYIYIDNTLIKSENVLDVNIRYLNAILELGPINAFVKDLNFNCTYTDGVNVSNLEYNLPLTDSLYEKNNLIQPVNYNARFLTTPQLIDNITNKDLFNNETLRIVNF